MPALNVSGDSTKANRGSTKSPDSTASTFHSKASPRKIGVDFLPEREDESEPQEEALVVEKQEEPDSERSYFEELDFPHKMPPLTHALILMDVTNLSRTSYNSPT